MGDKTLFVRPGHIQLCHVRSRDGPGLPLSGRFKKSAAHSHGFHGYILGKLATPVCLAIKL